MGWAYERLFRTVGNSSAGSESTLTRSVELYEVLDMWQVLRQQLIAETKKPSEMRGPACPRCRSVLNSATAGETQGHLIRGTLAIDALFRTPYHKPQPVEIETMPDL